MFLSESGEVFKIVILVAHPHYTFILILRKLNREFDPNKLSTFMCDPLLGLRQLKVKAFLLLFNFFESIFPLRYLLKTTVMC